MVSISFDILFYPIKRFRWVVFPSLIAVVMITDAIASMDPRFEIDTKLLGGTAQKPHTTRTLSGRIVKKSGPKSGRDILHGLTHTVKAGDNLFKILMRDYGLNNDEAEVLIDQILRENNIHDIRRLKVGQKVLIPPFKRGSIAKRNILPSTRPLRLEVLANPLSELEANLRFKQTWEKILPADGEGAKLVSVNTPTFSLSLDPQKYPSYPAMDNGRLVVDADSSIPPLVKALISEKDPSVRIISESPVNGRKFLSSILHAANFYSVEEDFILDYGVDPKLVVTSDFKIEKNQDSVLNQAVILLNAGRNSLPPVIRDFLKQKGFSLYEPFAAAKTESAEKGKPFYQLVSTGQSSIIDGLLASLSIQPERERKLDIFLGNERGISLSVHAERYFEKQGKKTIVTRFDGDPVTYTLFRILETRGYRVVILDPQDDFRGIAEKIVHELNIKGDYALHILSPGDDQHFSLRMSGYRMEGEGLPSGGVFITDLEVDDIIREALLEMGYVITSR